MSPLMEDGFHATNATTNRQADADFERVPHGSSSNGTVFIDGYGGQADAIAIIGMATKLPQDAASAEAFWQMLLEGRSAMTEVPEDRFNIDAFYHPDGDRLNTLNTRSAHFMKTDLAAFDAPFFSIPKAEAESLDPQQRGLLECTHHAFENAGIPLQMVNGSKTGVYVGSFAREYDTLFSRDPDLQPKYQASGTGQAMMSNRLSWFYDLRGPSMTIDTACSSSLNALHVACQSLRAKESTMAVVAGCNVILNPDTIMMSLSNLGFLSPDGLSYSFDERANGYSRGEGFGVVIIKTVSQALADNDTIRAVIRATHSNQDGKTPGITQPSEAAQALLIRETYEEAGLDTRVTRFFEAHGTGTQIGDTTEAAAIHSVFGKVRTPSAPLVIGAVKSNIGHLEGASGIASIIKTVMVLENGIIPPNANFEKSNQNIPVEEWNIKFPVKSMPWPTQDLRRASVNSFGYGGANAHIVLDDAYGYLKSRNLDGHHHTLALDQESKTKKSSGAPRPRLLVWSAADEGGPQRLVAALKPYLDNGTKRVDQQFIADMAYTLAAKRSVMPWRTYLALENDGLPPADLWSGCIKPVRASAAKPKLAFIFTGQGAAWYAMGRELFNAPVFAQSLSYSARYLQEVGCKWSLMVELQKDESTSRVSEAQLSQPICTALQIALMELLATWNIFPDVVIGHSSGEIAAAHCAGAVSHRAAISIAYFRGLLSARLIMSTVENLETMMAIALPFGEAEVYVSLARKHGELSVACINSPKNVTVSGSVAAIEYLRSMLEKDGIFARRLNVNVAYHSPSMKRISDEYMTLLQGLNAFDTPPKPRTFPQMFSSVTAQNVALEDLRRPEYWVRNMVEKVNFAGALQAMRVERKSSPVSQIVELGPTGALRRAVSDTLGDLPYFPTLQVSRLAYSTMLSLAGALWSHGSPVDLLAVNDIDHSKVEMLTDLPSYPFNHAHTYWYESRLSRNFRFRTYPRHELLGTPAMDWNPLEAKWRNILSSSEHPWMKDHGFNGSLIYPASGMMIMAFEAVRQVTKTKEESITELKIKDVTFSKAIVMSGNVENIETHFFLRPRKEGRDVFGEQYDFRLCSLSGEEWVENCHGTVIIETEGEVSEIDQGKEDMEEKRKRLQIHADVVSNCNRAVVPKQMYENLATFGFDFGPTFQTLKDIQVDAKSNAAAAAINLYDWITKVPEKTIKIQPHLIHPTALDGIFHLPVTGISKGGWKPVATMVPTFLRELRLSGKLLGNNRSSRLRVSSKLVFGGLRDKDFDMTATDPEDGDIIVSVDGYRVTTISSIDMVAPGVSSWRRLCFQSQWKIDISTATNEAIFRYCNDAAELVELHTQAAVDTAELACLYYMRRTLESSSSFDTSQPHLSRYIEWIRYYLEQEKSRVILESKEMKRMLHEASYAESVLSDLEASGPEGKVFVAIGQKLFEILQGKVDVLELLFHDGLLEQFYSGQSFTANYEKMKAYVDLMAHKNPNMSVLEIGAGTGGATAAILGALGPEKPNDPHGTSRFQEYTYTDISASFFEKAKARFGDHADRLVFRTLDIGKSTQHQGFDHGKYDLVVASCVLHATANIRETLLQTGTLLKPGGRLLLLEPCQINCARLTFVFGLLPGWWLSEEKHRHWGPLLTDTRWDQELRYSGFSGADVRLRDLEAERHTSSTKQELAPLDPRTNKGIIIIDPNSDLQVTVAERIQAISNTSIHAGYDVHPLSNDILDTAIGGGHCISLLELERPLLWCITAEQLRIIQNLVKQPRYFIWISGNSEEDPRMGLSAGFGRAMCSENDNLDFITLSLQNSTDPDLLTVNVLSIVQASWDSPGDEVEQEYQERNGVLQINRVTELNGINDAVFQRTVPQKSADVSFGSQDRRSITLTTASPGLLSALQFIDDGYEPEIGSEEVMLAVKAVGVNFKNVMVALGQIPDTSLGQECSGVVTAVGNAVSVDEFRVDDRVFCTTKNAFRNYARGHKCWFYKLPDEMSFATAAAVPIAFTTAYYSLFHLARLAPGESVLIHAAAGGVGQATIQLAQTMTNNIYATVSSDEKKSLLIELYGIPEDQILSSRHKSFAQGIKRMTGGRGVDIVLNSLSGDYLKESIQCVAPLGRFVEIGKKDMFLRSKISLNPFLRGISLLSADLSIVAREAKEFMEKMVRQTMSIYLDADNPMRPPQPLRIFNGGQIEEAFRSLQTGRNSGKAVIELSQHDTISMVPSMKPAWRFDSNATYVIAGGSGGLGRSIARWMATRNAKHILLLSRSGTSSEDVNFLIKELGDIGVAVASPPCDVSDAEAVRHVFEECQSSMPPIKGCVQGSMVLRDGLFENMTHENFHAVLKPKIQGTWNLHRFLPTGLDFFLILSSTGGVFGSRAQSNYAAASTYQDAFAKYRVSLGEKCTSLDLGLMLAVGFAAERQHITDALRTAGYEGIHEIEFHAMLSHFCDPTLPIAAPADTQVITGVATPASLASKNLREIFWMSKPIFQGLRQMDRDAAKRDKDVERDVDYRMLIEQTSNVEAAGDIIADALVRKLATALNVSSADIEVDRPVYAYGVDSLVAVEIRYWFLKEFKAQVAVFEVLRSESIRALSLLVASKTQFDCGWRSNEEMPSTST